MSQINKPFHSYTNFARISLKLHTNGPLLIKSGDSDLLPSSKDMRFMRDASGQVLIPGSTLKGFFKGNLDRMNEYFEENSLEKYFGSQEAGSHFYFNEFQPSDLESIKFESRPQIAIDKRTMGTQRGALMFLECLSAGAKFSGAITIRNSNFTHFGLLGIIYQLTNLDLLKIGFNKSRGYGSVSFEVEKIEFTIFDHDSMKIEKKSDKLLKISDGSNEIEVIIEDTKDFQIKNGPISDIITIESTSAQQFLEKCIPTIKKTQKN